MYSHLKDKSMFSDWLIIQEFPSSIEAEIVAGKLEASGIEAKITSDDCGGVRSFMTIATAAKLWIHKSDYEKAIRLLKA